MSEELIVNDPVGEEQSNDSGNGHELAVTRRNFLQGAMMVASGVALSSVLRGVVWESHAEAAQATCPGVGQAFRPIMEIQSSTTTKTLQAVLKVLNENKNYLAASVQGPAPVCNSGQMRYFSAYDPRIPNAPVWPDASLAGAPTTGPTFRARVGDTVQITLLNQVDVSVFGNSLDAAERGLGCDTAISVGPGGAGTNTYPGAPPFDITPDCFHGSSTTNLHFHGTHVSPSTIADNVLIAVRPSPRVNGKPIVTEQSVKADFDQVFAACTQGHSPQKWADLPQNYQRTQQELLTEYDMTAPWKGGRGLPVEEQLWLKDDAEIKAGRWPQYYVGAFPNCFTTPIWNGQPTSMGQAPGTHWYHAHKHGSTALNLANGMAGALIIEGPYDDTLKPFFTKQLVLVLQQFGSQVNLMRNSNTNTKADLVFVNGQFAPVLDMNPNEMQFWRVVNACHQRGVAINAPTGIKWVQTAQDGVQLDPRNYANPANMNGALSIPAAQQAPFGSLSPGNRVDFLVRAPSAPGTYDVTFPAGPNPKVVLFTVKVKQNPNVPPIPTPMPFPTQAQFPAMPGFLADINPADVTVRRDLHFRSIGAGNPNPPAPTGRSSTAPFAPPSHTINGKKFEDHIIDQTMMLGTTEEWTLYNDTGGAAHPFHIHINPFQVIEIFNPKASATPVKLPTPWVWWDDFAIPPAAPPKGSPSGTPPVSGYVKFLTRFVDYTGMYVLHCHILGHEDRGMMQLVQVVTNRTDVSHH